MVGAPVEDTISIMQLGEQGHLALGVAPVGRVARLTSRSGFACQC